MSSDIISWFLFILLLGTCITTGLIINRKKEQPTNYKNIAVMAQNLSVCKVGTRKQVLTELYTDPDWTEEEVDSLKSVLEGMLGTRLHIDKPGQKPTKGLIAKGK